ncbi:MAG TPA: SGNH/GDSL hydrolase family protein [Methylomirabilota bacterium]|nr:SGNH/GDSL hydrolase family protein [Methylomirabilota bacterium]
MQRRTLSPMKKILTRENLYYFLFLFVFILIALEIFGRVYLSKVLQKSSEQKFRFNSYRIYEHVPGFHEGDGKKDWIIINRQGFRRAADVTKKKQQNTFRVFLMGGSAAHGISSAAPYPLVHIDEDQTIDAYLERKLKQLHPDHNIEIINAAVTGYQVFQHTTYILSELLDYHPDMVIFFDGANDHYFNNPDYDYWGENRYQFWKSRLRAPSIGGWFDYFFLWLSRFSGFARGYYAWRLTNDPVTRSNHVRPVIDYSDPDSAIAAHKIIARKSFLRAIETNINILKTNNIQPVICLQPMQVLRISSMYSIQEKSFYQDSLVNKNIQVLYPTVLKELTDLTGQYQVPFINMVIPFNDPAYKGKQLFIDYCHLSPLGAEVVADNLLQAVDSIWVKSFSGGQ